MATEIDELQAYAESQGFMSKSTHAVTGGFSRRVTPTSFAILRRLRMLGAALKTLWWNYGSTD